MTRDTTAVECGVCAESLPCRDCRHRYHLCGRCSIRLREAMELVAKVETLANPHGDRVAIEGGQYVRRFGVF